MAVTRALCETHLVEQSETTVKNLEIKLAQQLYLLWQDNQIPHLHPRSLPEMGISFLSSITDYTK